MHQSSLHGYLELEGHDWYECLEKSLAFLRKSWDGKWVGLSEILNKSMKFLNISEFEESIETINIIHAAKQVALQIEKNYAAPALMAEPKYHNRLHTADALTSMSILLAIQSKKQVILNKPWIACALLTVIAHDFGHTGKINHFESEIELNTMKLLRPILNESNIDEKWYMSIKNSIVKSDFSIVHKNHDQVKGQKFEYSQEWMTLFLNESDVMASASEKFGPELGKALAREWEAIGLPSHQTVATLQGRKAFLTDLIFSSEAANDLEMNQRVAKELSQL